MADLAMMETRDMFGHIVRDYRGIIADKFLVPPFSVLNARGGWWQERKAKWIGIGIESEIGRGFVRPHGKDTRPVEYIAGETYSGGDCWRGGRQKNVSPKGMTFGEIEMEGPTATGTSIFDPVVCELVYRWFCPPSGQVLDPFAGGSVRGIIATILGRQYWGCDLRPEQVEANQSQAETICNGIWPTWTCGDALDVLAAAPTADLVFSCPPYGDLERYSDDPRDLSTMEYHTFIAAYKRIIRRCYERLKNNRFACFVVGEFRDGKGRCRNFVGDTVEAFRQAGFDYYNEAILVTSCGSLPIRINGQFTASRKLGKTHQNVLVFVKGDPKIAATEIGEAAQ